MLVHKVGGHGGILTSVLADFRLELAAVVMITMQQQLQIHLAIWNEESKNTYWYVYGTFNLCPTHKTYIYSKAGSQCKMLLRYTFFVHKILDECLTLLASSANLPVVFNTLCCLSDAKRLEGQNGDL